MKNIQFLLSGIIIFLTLSLSAQQRTYEFKTSSVGEKLQSEVGSDFRFVSFNVKGIENNTQQKALLKTLEANTNFKRVSMNANHEFHGFINKELKAKDVRKILLAQGLDFKFDSHKFKGCYSNEQLKQEFKK